MSALLDRPVTPRSIEAPGPRGWRAPLLVGVAAAVVAVAFSWVPSVWYDEAATVVSATRSWSALAREVRHVDAVHTAYYALMHVWFTVVGYSPFTLRLPSALAVGAAAALTVVLGRRLAGARVGVLGGVFFALLPRVTWMGAEGRSFALGTLLAVAATILFVEAVERTRGGRRSWGWWVAYAAVSALGGVVFLYLVLLTVGHGVTAALPLLRRRTRGRADTAGTSRALGWWGIAAAAVVAAVLPVARASSAQSEQIDWIQHISAHTVQEVLMTQWAYENPGFAVFLCVLAVAGALLALRNQTGRRLVAVVLPWAAVPTVALIAASLVTSPLYSPRYLSFGAPAAALCMAAAVAAVPARASRPAAVVAVLLAAALTAPTWVQQRTVTAKDDSAWNRVAALVARERATEPAGERDAVLYGPVERHPKATSRIVAETYPAAFAGLRDPLLVTPARRADGLWETQRPLADAGRVLAAEGASAPRVVWFLTAVSPDDRSVVTSALAADGYHADRTWELARTRVVRYER